MNGTVRVLAPGQLDLSYNNKSSKAFDLSIKSSQYINVKILYLNLTEPATEPNLLVLGTDYKNYAVLYSCTEHTKVFHASKYAEVL